MKVLLDHNFPPQLRTEFSEAFEVETASYHGWEGIDDDALLRVAEGEFAVLVTLDTSLAEQQNLADFEIGIVVLDVHPIYPDELRKHLPSLNFAIHVAAREEAVVRVTEEAIDFDRSGRS
jgi:predicted nuclease of predicted toxin-antitoxin system